MVMRQHRVKLTTVEPPAADSPEGYRAAWWRERILGYSRPQLAAAIGLHENTIADYENSATVPQQYSLACAALQIDRIYRLPFFENGRFLWPTG
jgi:DNA-binding XRE family transcriptional regulator